MTSYNAHCFPVELAVKIGLRESILLQYFYHWHINNTDNPAMQIEGRTWFYLSAPKIASAFPYFSDKQVRTIMDHLEAQGMLMKGNHANNKMLRTTWYSLTDSALEFFDFPEKANAFAQMGKWSDQTGKCKSYNNKVNNISSNEDNINKGPAKFNFRKALLDAGVEPEVADAWLQVRKAKKAVNTEIAWKAIEKEIGKTASSANDCIRLSVENSWSGFKAEWCQVATARTRTTPAPSQASRPANPGKYDFSNDWN